MQLKKGIKMLGIRKGEYFIDEGQTCKEFSDPRSLLNKWNLFRYSVGIYKKSFVWKRFQSKLGESKFRPN